MYVINAVLKTNPEKIYGMSCEAISYLCASGFAFKNFSKLAKQDETIWNYRKQILVMIKHCSEELTKLTLEVESILA